VDHEPWELDDNPKSFSAYNWYADELPARKFYLLIAEFGHRLRHLMTDEGPINMIGYCEQCAEGVIDEYEISDLAEEHRPEQCSEFTATNRTAAQWRADEIYIYVADRYKVSSRGIYPAADVSGIQACVDAGMLQPHATYEDIEACRTSLVFQTARERTELEWGAIVRCIYGPNPFVPVPFSTAWRSESAVALARTAYDTRDFTLLPMLADALEEAGCDHTDILSHCRDPKGVHARGCWVVDLVLNKS